MKLPGRIWPGGSGMRRRMESDVTVLPHPDSPTIPSVSPGCTSKETPFTEQGSGTARAVDGVSFEGLTRLHLEGDAVHRARRAAALLGDEVGLEVTHAEQGLGHTASLRGSSASRSASPTAFSAITTSEIASPGNVADHQATAILCQPSAIMLPQLGVGEGTPIPRNESPASSSIMWPMPRAPETMIGAAALGRT